MTLKHAIRLASAWSQGHVCTLREGEVKEYHEVCLAALRAQQEAEKNEQPVLCSDCMYWEPTGALGGPSIGEIERLGKCRWIRGVSMASDFCSRGKRRPLEKEET